MDNTITQDMSKFTHVAFPVEAVNALCNFLAEKKWMEVNPAMELFKHGQLCALPETPQIDAASSKS